MPVLSSGRSSGFTYSWVSIFATSFGFLEAIVVIYLRWLYYPDGFSFPLSTAPLLVYPIEVIREISTLLMLATTGMLVGRNAEQRFAWFLLAFGIWDIFFYLALMIFTGWPSSLLTWDLLFLVPVVWDGPVLAPLLCSVTMIGFGITVIEADRGGKAAIVHDSEWVILAVGATCVFITFIWDYSLILIREGYFSGTYLAGSWKIMREIIDFTPQKFNWYLFIIGEILILSSILSFGSREFGNRRNKH